MSYPVGSHLVWNLTGRVLSCAAFAIVLAWGASGSAQTKEKEEPEFPPPLNVVREATDGMLIRCTYYYGGIDEKRKKQTVPIIIVHDYGEDARYYDGLATMLQKLGHAVIVPDLRGHGGSTSYKNGIAKFTRDDLERNMRAGVSAMLLDVEAAKSYLMEENNEGELNIELLTVIGVGGMGSVVALNWVASDWNWPMLPGRKQGQDVKALVLLSPAQSFKGVVARDAVLHPFLENKTAVPSSILLIVGQNDRESYNDMSRMYKAWDKNHEVGNRDPRKNTLFKIEERTSLSGSKLLNPRLPFKTSLAIAQFVKFRLVDQADKFPWKKRK